MPGHELAVEQGESADAQARDEPGDRDLRCVARAADHALTEEGPAQREAVKSAGEPITVPYLDRMREAAAVQGDKGLFDLRIDPGVGAALDRLGAQRDDALERGVGGHAEAIGGNRLAQRMRQMEAVERQDRARLGFDPIDAVGIAPIGHREHPDGIGAEQELRIEDVVPNSGHRISAVHDATTSRSVGHCARRFSITCHKSAKALAPTDLAAKAPTGARRAAIVSTTLAIGMTGQSG